jgi:ribosomal protein S8
MLLLSNLLNFLKQAFIFRQGIFYFCYYRSNFLIKFLRLLTLEGFILGFVKNGFYARVKLKYSRSGIPTIKFIKSYSKPSTPRYNSYKFLLTTGYGMLLTTKKGLLSCNQAIKKMSGGRLLCQIF